MQLEFNLFKPEKTDQYAHLYAHWMNDLKRWPEVVFEFRHHRNTTGWSMARGTFIFAKFLLCRGEITIKQFRRYWRFHRRVQRWNSFPDSFN